MLRGGAYKPRTSPYAFQGLKKQGLQLLAEAGQEFGMPVVTEVMDSYLKGHLDDFSTPYIIQMSVWAGGGIIAWSSGNKRIHDFVATVVVTSQIAWVSYQLSDLEWSIAQ